MDKYNHIHFIGIGGIGMSGIAQILVQRGKNVSGSDVSASIVTNRLSEMGVKIYIGHRSEQVTDSDLIVISTAISDNNPELLYARKNNIPISHRSDLMAYLVNEKRGVAVSGVHGKTTTTAMISLIAVDNLTEPTVLIGGDLNLIGGNAYDGNGEYAITEADESDGSFLKLFPKIAVVTNIESDHLDYYGTLDNIKNSFQQFVNQVQDDGMAVLCFDCDHVKKLARGTKKYFVSYGIQSEADYTAKNICYNNDGTSYELYYQGKFINTVNLSVFGKHNVLNSLAAIATTLKMGIPLAGIINSLKKFTGAKRRFDTKGKVNNIWVVDDYAHHPTEIHATLTAAKQTNAGRIICIFQPHRYTRTESLRDEFGKCFSNCDILILTSIYAASEQPIAGIDGYTIVDEVKNSTGKEVLYIDKLTDIPSYLASISRPNDLVITMGAGNIYTVGEELLKILK